MEILKYFTDPILRAPTIGSMLMCLSSALVGILVFIRKRSLLGEALSHASYPGVVISIILLASFFSFSEDVMVVGVLAGAFLTSLAGLWAIDFLEKKLRIKNDAALCFVLSLFFGVGLLIASRIQSTHTLWYKQIQVYLFGQAATMTDEHILVYGVLAFVVILSMALLYRFIEILYFDRSFARTLGIPILLVEGFLFILLTLAIVIGIRSVGVVLMSAMLISPVVAARQMTDKLKTLLLISGLIGMAAGFVGNVLSLEISLWLTETDGVKFSLPTGPMIVLSASFFCILSTLFAPKGLIFQFIRNWRFRQRCQTENLLKSMWKQGEGAVFTLKNLSKTHHLSPYRIYFRLLQMKKRHWVESLANGSFKLTAAGLNRGAAIVRLHRLWEVYLVHLGQGREKVHHSAEEMEHILTPEMEKELTLLLGAPKKDPHHQPIPEPSL